MPIYQGKWPQIKKCLQQICFKIQLYIGMEVMIFSHFIISGKIQRALMDNTDLKEFQQKKSFCFLFSFAPFSCHFWSDGCDKNNSVRPPENWWQPPKGSTADISWRGNYFCTLKVKRNHLHTLSHNCNITFDLISLF